MVVEGELELPTGKVRDTILGNAHETPVCLNFIDSEHKEYTPDQRKRMNYLFVEHTSV